MTSPTTLPNSSLERASPTSIRGTTPTHSPIDSSHTGRTS